MDEHIIVEGKIVHEDVMIIDDNKITFEFWLNKHIGYCEKMRPLICYLLNMDLL